MSDQPLWLPKGSVRAIIALAIIGGYLFGLEVPQPLVMAVITAYFVQRGQR